MKNLNFIQLTMFSYFASLAGSGIADVALTTDGKVPGKPFENLQIQVDDLQNQINTIELTPGPQGPQGLQGLKGETGLTGATGAAGAKGDTGLQGLKGDTGLQGLKGDTGAQGPQGLVGLTGPQGLAGTDGTPGINGLQGPIGADGPQGPYGVDGISVSSETVNIGDPVCPNGGTRLTSVSGINYICNGVSNDGLTSMEGLNDLPCNVGTPFQGKVTISIDDQTSNISMKCLPTGAVFTLTVNVIAQTTYEYQCGSYQCEPHQCNAYNCNSYSCGVFGESICYETCYETCYNQCPEYCTARSFVRITSDPLGINLTAGGQANSLISATTNYTFPEGTEVTLSSSSDTTTFSGDCNGVGTCSFTMDSDNKYVTGTN